MFRNLFEYIDNVCLKSSQNITILLSKKTLFLLTRQKSKKKIQLTTSILYFRYIKTLFQNINFVVLINVNRFVFALMLQML